MSLRIEREFNREGALYVPSYRSGYTRAWRDDRIPDRYIRRCAPVRQNHYTADSGSTSVTSQATVMTNNPGVNNLIVVCMSWKSSGVSSAPTDTIANTWAQAGSDALNGTVSASAIWYAVNTTAAANTVTAHISVTSTHLMCAVLEYSGTATSSVLDGSNTGTGNSTAPASGTITTTNASDVLVGVTGQQSNAVSIVGANGFTVVDTESVFRGADEEQIVSATGTYNSSFTLGTGSAWASCIAAFKAAAAAGAFPPLNPAFGGSPNLDPLLRM